MSDASSRYARALLDVLYPDKAEAGLQQLEGFSLILSEHPALQRLLENPAISETQREQLFQDVASQLGLEPGVSRFFRLLIEQSRLPLLDEMVASYRRLLDERVGIVRASVTAAHPLDARLQRELAASLERITGKQVRMEVSVDPSLIGGVVASVGSTVYDGSVRQQLEVFRRRLVQE
jgi:F-type H+-transporting ATPase subunit delta